MSEVKRLWVESGYISATQAGARFIPATADEIKAAHAPCRTCELWEGKDDSVEAFCGYMMMRMLDAQYCHNHTPKAEGAKEGGEGG